ncbi:MAG TPA: MFS transporter [Candidatus Dormibacteraeota bacterium]|nr:MFS transporter [Candidatus Dormibacteraeota bacterium]
MAEASATAGTRTPALTRRDILSLALLWLGGFDLRVTLLAVPPLIPAIHRDLGLDEKGVSILTGLPVLLLAGAAIPGSLLIARLGARRALVAGLLVLGLGGALRGAGPALVPLFAMTLVMGAGVAVSQPAFPTLTRAWFPARIAIATAVYSNGLLFGETLPASLTGPLVVPALGGSWPLALAFWSTPAFATAALLLALTAHDPARQRATTPRRWMPDFRDGRLWRLGLVMGFASAAYFGTNAFIPDFVRATGHAGLKDAALTSLNASQLIASFGMLVLGDRLVARRLPFVAAGVLFAAAGVALVLTPGPWTLLWAGVIGFASALALVLTLALPPLLAAERDVPRFSAGLFLIMYGFSFAGPVVGGAAWDATGWPPAAFLTLAAGGAVMAALAAGADLRRRA